MGRHKKTAVVLVDCGFVSLMSATTIGTVMSTKCEIRVDSVPGRPKRESIKKEDSEALLSFLIAYCIHFIVSPPSSPHSPLARS